MIQPVLNNQSALLQTVNIGVTGHRNIPMESSARVQKQIELVLMCIKNAVQQVRGDACYKDFFDRFDYGQEAKLRIISQLAEGIDRLVAHIGLDQGYILQSLLPFRQDVYEKTFVDNPSAMQDFHDLLKKSDNIFEIACSNDNTSQAYADASRVMLSHSDLLLAVWNGKKTKYIAGTYATMQAAKRLNFPIICIPAQEYDEAHGSESGAIPSDCVAFISEVEVQFFRLNGDAAAEAIERFTACIRTFMEKILLPHRIVEGVEAYTAKDAKRRLKKTAQVYTSTHYVRKPRFNYYVRFEKWMRMFSGNTPLLEIKESQESEVEKRYIAEFKNNASGYWFKLKKHFSEMTTPLTIIYRKRLFFRNLLPVFALIALVLAINADWWFGFTAANALHNGFKWAMYGFQFFLWIWVFFLIWQESHKGVKNRFFAYRAIAEHCRLCPFLWAVGYCNVRYRHSYSLSHNGHGESAWYYRLLARNAGFASSKGDGNRVVLDKASIVAWLLWIKKDFLIKQYKYHADRLSRLSILCSRLNWMAIVLYIAGMSFVMIRGFAHLLKDYDANCYSDFNVIIIAIAFTVPTVAAFFSSYAGNFNFSSHRAASHDMCITFKALCKEADSLCEEIRSAQQEQLSPDSSLVREARLKRQIMEGDVAYTHILDFSEKISTHCLNELTDWVNSPNGNLNKLL